MEYRQLGNTGVFVSRICLGAMTFGGAGGIFEMIGGLRQHDVDALVGNSLDAGVNFIDTANVYAAGESETLTGKALGQRRKDVVIATKVFGRMGPGANQVGLSRLHIMREVEASLLRLNTDYIDLYQIHGFDPLTPFEETLGAMTDLVRQGKVRYIGCSNLTAWQIMKSLGVSALGHLEKFITLQAYYSLSGRELEREIVPMLLDQKIGLLVWSPLAGGLLSGKYSRANQKPADSRRSDFDFPIVDKERTWKILDAMAPIAKAHECSPARVSLAWLLAKPVVSSVIIGAKRHDQLQDNLAAIKLTLTHDELRRLDEVSAPPPEYPGWMMPFQGSDRLEVVDRFKAFREAGN